MSTTMTDVRELSVEEISRHLAALAAKRPQVEDELQKARQCLAEAEGEHERVACAAVLDGDATARHRVEVAAEACTKAERQVRTLTHVLSVLDKRQAKLELERQRAVRHATRDELSKVAAEQTTVGRTLDDKLAELRPVIRRWLELGLHCYQLRADLGHSPGRTPYVRMSDAILTVLGGFDPELSQRENVRLSRVVPAPRVPGTFQRQSFSPSVGVVEAETPSYEGEGVDRPEEHEAAPAPAEQ